MPSVTVGTENSAPIEIHYEDRVLPIEACGPRTHEGIAGSEFVVIEGASHGLCWTHADEVNAELLRFFK